VDRGAARPGARSDAGTLLAGDRGGPFSPGRGRKDPAGRRGPGRRRISTARPQRGRLLRLLPGPADRDRRGARERASSRSLGLAHGSHDRASLVHPYDREPGSRDKSRGHVSARHGRARLLARGEPTGAGAGKSPAQGRARRVSRSGGRPAADPRVRPVSLRLAPAGSRLRGEPRGPGTHLAQGPGGRPASARSHLGHGPRRRRRLPRALRSLGSDPAPDQWPLRPSVRRQPRDPGAGGPPRRADPAHVDRALDRREPPGGTPSGRAPSLACSGRCARRGPPDGAGRSRSSTRRRAA